MEKNAWMDEGGSVVKEEEGEKKSSCFGKEVDEDHSMLAGGNGGWRMDG